jgi:LPXTG-motif cell wall-anchored protein
MNGCTVFVGTNATFDLTGDEGIITNDDLTLICDGLITATGTIDSGINIFAGKTLTLDGSGTISVTGAVDYQAIKTNQPILMGNYLTLELTNNAAVAEEHFFEATDPDSTWRWMLHNATSPGPFTDMNIKVSLYPNSSATILRLPTPPTITSADNLTVTVGIGGSLLLTATGTPPIIATLIGAPAGVGIVASNLTVAPTVAVGTYHFTISAAGAMPPDATQAFTLTVLATPGAPTITSANNLSVVSGTGGSLALTATGTSPISFSLSGAPEGVTLSGSTLNVASTLAVGTYTFTITAANGNLPNATQTFTLTVTAKAAAIPETGDTAMTFMIIALLVTALGASVLFARYRRRVQE